MGKAKASKRYVVEIRHKPLINLDNYRKDWDFKVVGSVK